MDNSQTVFKYFNGERELYGDPLAIERKLRAACGGKPKELADAVNDETADDVKWAAAEEKLIRAVRDALQMAPFDVTTGKGATDATCRKAWDVFWRYMDDQKKMPAS